MTYTAAFVILYAAYNLITAAKNVHVPNVRLLSAVTCFGVVGGGSMGVGLYTRDVNFRVVYAWMELPTEIRAVWREF
jgi:hypothetical protein